MICLTMFDSLSLIFQGVFWKMHKKQVSFTTFAKHILDDFGWFVRIVWVLLDYYCLKQTIQPCAKFHNIIALMLLPLPNSTLSKGVSCIFLASRTCWPIAVATCCVSRRGVSHHICRSFKAYRHGEREWKLLKMILEIRWGFP